MSDCCPRPARFAATPTSGDNRVASRTRSRFCIVRTAIATQCLRLLGWHRLERLLASIPDSNDDFGIG